jgi:hypothetical protein
MWIYVVSSLAALGGTSLLASWYVSWYSKRCINHSMNLVQTKLHEFESIAKAYTSNGTPSELKEMIESLEFVMDELQFIQDNNLKSD